MHPDTYSFLYATLAVVAVSGPDCCSTKDSILYDQ